MAETIAKTAIKKARYFLTQAEAAQSDAKILSDRLPFAASLEASIVNARSSLDHLRTEFKPAHNARGYKRWHQDHWDRLKKSNPLFDYFTTRRDFIIHEKPEGITAKISAEVVISAQASVSVETIVIPVNGTAGHSNSNAVAEPPKNQVDESPKNQGVVKSELSQSFHFADDSWSGRPATEYVASFIDVCEDFISDAEKKFL